MQSNSRSQTRIDQDDVLARFNISYPEIGLRAQHLSFLMEILTDSYQNPGEVSKKKNTSRHNTTQLSQNETRPITAESPLLKQGQKPGREKIQP